MDRLEPDYRQAVARAAAVAATFGSAISVALNGSDEGEGTAASPFATIALRFM